jgi:hypothetical protein
VAGLRGAGLVGLLEAVDEGDDLVVTAEAAHVGGEGAGIGAAADVGVGEGQAGAEAGGDHRAEVGV